ncbi:MAG: response regulator [Ruminococcus sp.]|nr:response regulator [Ruminococcus sp.]
MKKYYNIVVGIVLVAILSVFIALYQFQEEEGSANEYVIYDMNDNWRCISVTSVMEQQEESGGAAGTDPETSEMPKGEVRPDMPAAEGAHRQSVSGHEENKGHTTAIQNEEEVGFTVSLPYEGTSKPGEMLVFQNTIPHEYAGLTLTFYSTESTVRVSLNNEVIYQYGVENQRMFGKSPGSRLNFVDLPEHIGDGTLRIELTSSYANAAATLGRVSVSQRDIAILQLIESNLVNLFCCIIILISAVVFLILGIVCIFTNQKKSGVFWLAALGIDVGLYYLVKTELLSVIYGTMAIYSIGQYLFIMLIPILLLMYLKKDLEKTYPKVFMILFAAVNLNILVQLILQVSNIYDLADMAKFTAGWFRLVIVVGIFLYIKAAVTDRKKVNWLMAGMGMVLLFGELLSLYRNAADNVQENMKYSQYAMTLFLFILACRHVVQVAQDYKEEAEENARLALAASEAKGKFLANMSHEIRTPINAVLGMDEMILRETKESRIREYAMDIFTAGKTLLSLVNDILDISKIESGKMEIVEADYDVSSMIHDLSNMIGVRAKEKDLQLHVEVDRGIPCMLHGDDVRVRQVLTNILTNAVKYTQEGDIWFRIRLDKKEGSKAVLYFEIEDTGIGIKEEDLPKLYAEFERIEEDRNRNIEGTGLGMSITVRLLQMMGSHLQVESVYGKGSKFFFSLEQGIVDDKPIGDFEQNVQQLAAEYTYAAGFTAPEAQVLVVDDNATNRKVFGNLLRQTQVRITEAESGARCLELVRQKRFDIIFLDHMMPEMDGIETLARMKKDSENLCVSATVIALTANAVSGAKEKYLGAGFDDYLSKPIVSAKLEKMLWNYLPKELLKEAAPADDAKKPEEAGAADDGKMAAAAEMPDLGQLPMVEGLDWNYAWLHLAGMELLQSTVEDFFAQIPMAAEKLDICYQEIGAKGLFDPYRIQVHAMKSLAATVGILPLAGMARVLEDAAGKEDLQVIQSLHPIFMTEWNGYREKLVGVFGIEAPEEKAEMEDGSVICALLEMLRLAMEEMDFDEADEKIKLIDTYRYKDEVQRNIELLKEAVENLDTEKTENYVRIIIDQLSKQKESGE